MEAARGQAVFRRDVHRESFDDAGVKIGRELPLTDNFAPHAPPPATQSNRAHRVSIAEDLDIWVEHIVVADDDEEEKEENDIIDVADAPAIAAPGPADAPSPAPAVSAAPADATRTTRLSAGAGRCQREHRASSPAIHPVRGGRAPAAMSLWARRAAADRTLEAAAKRTRKEEAAEARAAKRIRMGWAAEQAEAPRRHIGVNLIHELQLDKQGVGFAFGGVVPGVLHAKGQLVKAHQVFYSVGLAGKYRLHVGLRQQRPLPRVRSF